MPKSDIFVFLGGIEAWAILSRKITVAMNGGRGVELAHGHKKRLEICALLLGSGVLCFLAVGSHTAYVANADTLGVVAGAMRTGYIHVASLLYFSVGVDNIMIPYIRKTTLAMPLAYSVERVILTFWSGRAMLFFSSPFSADFSAAYVFAPTMPSATSP